ncbi:MAG: hypothetical protein R3185_05465 [Candidatus Thermoplasmatota archaeon]|nr:hypothetical protein [Candidatus Thermoplasmatota archaeon]
MADVSSLLGFLWDLLAGIREGHVTSLVAVALVAILLLGLVLPKPVVRLVVRSAMLGLLVVITYLGYQHADARFGQAGGWAALLLGAVFTGLILWVMVANARAERAERREEEALARAEAAQASMAGGLATPGQPPTGLLAQFQRLDPGRRNNIFSVIAFMFIAEFGVFSSVTINAQDPVIGGAFFVVFHLAAVIYILTSYEEKGRGLAHYAVVAVASVVVALLLYYTWTTDPLGPGELFPWGFFTESTMVASVTGVAFSLIISARG